MNLSRYRLANPVVGKVPIKVVYMFLRRFNMDPSRNEFAHLNVGRVYINHFQQYVVFLLFPLCIQTVSKLLSFHSKSSIQIFIFMFHYIRS